MTQLKEKLFGMGIDNHGLIVNATLDDNLILHAAYLTHKDKEVIIHDYA